MCCLRCILETVIKGTSERLYWKGQWFGAVTGSRLGIQLDSAPTSQTRRRPEGVREPPSLSGWGQLFFSIRPLGVRVSGGIWVMGSEESA